MLEGWYNDYLRMIHPRSPQEEIEYNNHTSDDIRELILLTESCFDKFKGKIYFLEKAKLETCLWLESDTIFILIGLLGDLKTISDNKNDDMYSTTIDDLCREFDNIISNSQREVVFLFEKEGSNLIEKYIEKWKDFVVNQIVPEHASDKILSYWDIKAQDEIFYDGSEEHSQFIKRIKSNENILPVLDYVDYMDSLSYRYFLSRALQLFSECLSISKYKRSTENLDEKLKERFVVDDRILGESAKKYFHKDYHWWYFGRPEGFYLDGLE